MQITIDMDENTSASLTIEAQETRLTAVNYLSREDELAVMEQRVASLKEEIASKQF